MAIAQSLLQIEHQICIGENPWKHSKETHTMDCQETSIHYECLRKLRKRKFCITSNSVWTKARIKEMDIPAAEPTLCRTPGWFPSENME